MTDYLAESKQRMAVMQFYTEHECDEWLKGRNRMKPDAVASAHSQSVRYPSEPYRMFFLAHWIATTFIDQTSTLLWITEWGIWPSSENWHLYYTLRRSNHDGRLLHEAPGHLFLPHEVNELTSYLQVAMLNGWGGYLLTEADQVNIFFSHDEFVRFFGKQALDLHEVQTLIASGHWLAK